MNILGLDYGERYVGVALSSGGREPLSLKTIRYRSQFELAKELERLLREYEIEQIVVGNAVNQARVQTVIKRALDNLKRPAQVIFYDEHLTTAQARKELSEASLTSARRRRVGHAHAAAAILRGYLEGVW